MTRVSVLPRKVTVKIGDAENRCRWCRDKTQWKRANIPVRLVLSRVPFKSGVWNRAYKMPKYVLSLLVKLKLKNLLSVYRYRLPRFRGKRQNQRVSTFWCNKSIEIDRLNYKLVSICSPFKSKNKTWQKFSLQMHGFLHEMCKYCIFRESVLGMPRIEIEFEFDMVFCFRIRLALYGVLLFSLGFTFNTLHDLLKVVVL